MDTGRDTTKRDAFIEDLVSKNFSTYFAATHPKFAKGMEAFRFTKTPVSPAVPHMWKYAEARKSLFELGDLLTADEAERRNINFVNPTLKNFMPSATLPTLRGGIQLLLPQEKAFTHRHSANAFRFVIEAPDDKAYSIVEGTRIRMQAGDLILTPSWTWHDHHYDGTQHAIWYDGLDVLMAFFTGAGFFQYREEADGRGYDQAQRSTAILENSFGPGLISQDRLVPDHVPPSTNPQLYYPYDKMHRMLCRLNEEGAGSSSEGVVVDYVNPLTGGPCFPSMRLSMRLIGARKSTVAMHRTENIIFIVKEGQVTFHIDGGKHLTAGPHDVVAIPSWVSYSIANDEADPAILFSYSDRPLLEKLQFYREELA